MGAGSFQGDAKYEDGKLSGIGENGEASYMLFVDNPTGSNGITINYTSSQEYLVLKVQVNSGDPIFVVPTAQGDGTATIDVYLNYGPSTLRLYNDGNATESDAYSYQRMGDQLIQQDRDIVFSLCEWGSHTPYKWGPTIGHSWRTTYDITNQPGAANWG